MHEHTYIYILKFNLYVSACICLNIITNILLYILCFFFAFLVYFNKNVPF